MKLTLKGSREFKYRELKHARFWDADGNRKRRFRMLGRYCLPVFFILLISNEEKILSNVNMVVWGQVKSESSSLSATVRVSKTRVLKFPINHDGNGNGNVTKQRKILISSVIEDRNFYFVTLVRQILANLGNSQTKWSVPLKTALIFIWILNPLAFQECNNELIIGK